MMFIITDSFCCWQDLQVKASPPVQPAAPPAINNDPAIIQVNGGNVIE